MDKSRERVLPFPINFILLAFLVVPSTCILNRHHQMIEQDSILNQDRECKQKFEHMERNAINRTDFTLVSLGRSTQRLRGKILMEQNVKLAQFLSIPYAEKPKRFQKADPMKGWHGVRDALHWPPHCMQNNLQQYEYLTLILNYSMSESCLYLNIWSPHPHLVRLANRTNRVQSRDSLLPVVVFIHGGAFNYMGTSMQAYYGGVVAALGKVLFVTLNFRVGLFGFFNGQHDQQSASRLHNLYPTNIGLHDQITAIRWVSEYIHHFGGDPTSITLHGQSAGAISIGLLMLSPQSSHLFHRAILQSGSPMMLKQMFSTNQYFRLVSMANCSGNYENVYSELLEKSSEKESSDEWEINLPFQTQEQFREIQCFENLPVEKLNEIQGQIQKESAISFSPVIPSDLLPEFPIDLLKLGNIAPKEVLLGANGNEAALYLHQEFPDEFPLLPTLNLSRSQIRQTIKRLLGDSTSMTERQFTQILFDMFTRNNVTSDAKISQHFLAFLSDFVFKGPVLKFAKSLSAASPKSTVYLYLFNQSATHFPPWIGPAHWIEMDYVFGIPLQEPHRFSEEQRQLSVRMIQGWTHFAKTGQMLSQVGLSWPPFSPLTGQHMVLQSNISFIGANLDMLYFDYFDLFYDAS